MGNCDNRSSQRHKEIQKARSNENKDISQMNNPSQKIINEQGMIKENPKTENYYLICPDCEIRSPHIEKLYYDEDLKDIMVKYTCICFQNPRKAKEIQLIKIFGKDEPKNMCNIHPEFKLKNFCLTCRRAICQICENELHNQHKIENGRSAISKKEDDKMIQIIKKKE